eukprot:scaffold381219_cov51-Prasinocladus_malaysianus.AAC.1
MTHASCRLGAPAVPGPSPQALKCSGSPISKMVAVVQSARPGHSVLPSKLGDPSSEYVAGVNDSHYLMSGAVVGTSGKRAVASYDTKDFEVFGKRTRSAPLYDITNGKGGGDK